MKNEHKECPCLNCVCKYGQESTHCSIWRKWFHEEWKLIKEDVGEDRIEKYIKAKAKRA